MEDFYAFDQLTEVVHWIYRMWTVLFVVVGLLGKQCHVFNDICQMSTNILYRRLLYYSLCDQPVQHCRH